jgi:Family of unknown function (DUF6496)
MRWPSIVPCRTTLEHAFGFPLLIPLRRYQREKNVMATTKKAAKKSSAKKYSPRASASVEREMKAMKKGTLKSGRSKKKVTNPKQAIAIGLSEARKSGAKVPAKKTAAKKTASKKTAIKKTAAKKTSVKKSSAKKTATKKAAKKSR